MAAYSYKCNLSFGLVFIPVKLVAATKNNDIGFNMIDKRTMGRIKYLKVNENGDKVEQSDIVKGYEFEDDKYVIFTDEDFEKIKTPKQKNIEIESFVSLDEIDPLYFNKPFYVVPSGAEKAFDVLVCAMEQSNRAAIAKTVLGTKETLVAMRVIDRSLVLSTLYFYDEIQPKAYVVSGEPAEKELSLAKAIIDGMREPFEPSAYHDEYRERLLSAIHAKAEGNEISKVEQKQSTGITDLMEALRRSLDEQTKKKKATASAKAIAKKKSSTAKAPKKKAE